MTIRVVLADDHEIVRHGLRVLLDEQDDVEVVAEVADGRAALSAVRETTPHVVVMDISMTGMNGIDATRRIMDEAPGVKVLCLSMHADEQFVRAVFDAGASGYVLKENSLRELIRGIRALMKNQKYVSPAIAGTVLEGYAAHVATETTSSLSRLTTREREVLQLLAEGHSTKAVGTRLHLSPKTVATHRENLMKKTEIDNVAGLTKFAIRHGLTTSDRDVSE